MALRGLKSNAEKLLADNGQQHLLTFYDRLDEVAKERFLLDLLRIDFAEMNGLYQRAHALTNGDALLLDDVMQPLAASQIEAEERCSKEKLETYFNRGLHEISEGRVGVILMAGGQGSRLGVTYPKGMYDVGLVSKKTLFQLQAERIRKVEDLAAQKFSKRGNIVWYIMTSGPTFGETEAFLKTNKYFGLDESNVVLFQQGLLPCFDMSGKMLLQDDSHLVLAPDGNGGIFKALEVNGILEDFQKRDVRYLHCHSVDNILVKVADPTFIGFCVERKADCGAKVVQKNSPKECVGVLCMVEKKVQVVEYSEITEKTAHLQNEDGSLTFGAGNICNHYFNAEFLAKIARLDMPLHVARKKIPHVNQDGVRVDPKEPNGIKIEKFVFDVFNFSDNFVAWEVPRYTEFSALKNSDASGKDCPKTAKQDLYRLHRIYLEKVGANVVGECIEIAPALSYAGEGLEHFQGQTITSPILLQ